MIEREGNLFDTESRILIHGVNTRGFMGAGIAREFRDRFPSNYKYYKTKCRGGLLKPGQHLVGVHHEEGEGLTVIGNLATQKEPGPDANYNWVTRSLMSFAETASAPHRIKSTGNIIAMPEIGCGIGGLHWDRVAKIVEVVEMCYPKLEFEVWHYNG